jgi:TruD family tRNA pseudouridine synthase
MNSQEAFARQKEIIEYYKKNNPELVTRMESRTEEEVFSEIGITNIWPNRPDGYLRFFPQDFIVEEVLENGQVVRVNEFSDQVNGEGKTLYANLIKIGIPTNVALQRLAEGLGVPENQIGYSGLKDSDALTSQKIAFTKLKLSAAEIKAKQLSNLVLTDFNYGPGGLNPGSLQGNEFTITIRTKGSLNEGEFAARVEEIRQYGFLNYYQAQRFGGARLISHKLGLLLCRGQFELAIKYFLFKKSAYDTPLVADIRTRAEKVYPDWELLEKIYEEFPYSFFNELRLVGFLKNDPRNFVGGLTLIKDQTTLWAYAYASWLFNRFISENPGSSGDIPLLLSNDPKVMAVYGSYLQENETTDFKKNLAPLMFIRMADRGMRARIFAEIIKYEFFPAGVVINFRLPKGAYATTFLANFFRLFDNYPVPDWVSHDEIDAKKLLGQGDLAEIKKYLADSWYSKLEEKQN